MGCCGHHRTTHQVEEQAYAPETPAFAASPCPECGYPTEEDFVLCPRCGAELLTACPECHRAVQADWTRCAYCGADVSGG